MDIHLSPNSSSCVNIKNVQLFVINHISIKWLKKWYLFYLSLMGLSSISCIVETLKVPKELNKTNLGISKVLQNNYKKTEELLRKISTKKKTRTR